MNQLQLLGAIEIGLIYSLVAIGVYITFKVIDFPDLTVDGSFTLGAAVSSAMIFSGYDPYLATFAAIFAGSLSGIITGYLNVRWEILGLLAGILTMTALYSINLRIMGRPNIAIIDSSTIFSNWSIIVAILVVTISIIFLLARFFASEFGLAIRAIGINPRVSSAYGINVGLMKIVALSISNAIVALAGSLFAQSQGFADISMGMGTIIVGLASVIIGEALLHPEKIWIGLVTCAIGSILYRITIAFALNAHDIGLEASDLNLITALLVALTMIISKLKKEKKRESGMIELQAIDMVFNKGTKIENHVLKSINFKVMDGQFVTIIGGNGAGKSTLMNVLSGNLRPTLGKVFIDKLDVTSMSVENRASMVSRVFQDPRIGTFADLTIEENMAIAYKRGSSRRLDLCLNKSLRDNFKEALSTIDIGLESRLRDKVSSLSGGQRQALSLIMATLLGSKILLLDEHTAALDPKIAKNIMQLTDKIIRKHKLTALMITHSMTQALEYGDRTIMMYHGELVRDMQGTERKGLSSADLVKYFDL